MNIYYACRGLAEDLSSAHRPCGAAETSHTVMLSYHARRPT